MRKNNRKQVQENKKEGNAKSRRSELRSNLKPRNDTFIAPCKKFEPITDKQEDLVHFLHTHPLVVGIAPAGCGKSYVSAMTAAKMLLEKKIERVVLSRPNVATGKSLGAFPGTIEDKLSPWLAPLLNCLKEGLGMSTYEDMLGKQIQIQPIETIRGMSFENTFVIIDESQNLTIAEIKAITTRIGEGTTMALLGDPAQSDLKGQSDLTYFAELCNKNDIEVPVIEFDFDDIVRSDICSDLVRMFYKENL